VPAVENLQGHRVVASPSAIEAAAFAEGALVFRIAPDDVLVFGDGPIEIPDEFAIVEPDNGWSALGVTEAQAEDILARHASWKAPDDRPILLQGMVAGLAAKVYLDGPRSKIIVAAPFAAELEDRLS